MDITRLNPWNWLKKEEQHQENTPAGYPESRERMLSPLENLHSEIDRFFENFLTGSGFQIPAPSKTMNSAFKPRIDISGNEKKYAVTAELPGVKEEDIHLELKGDALVIKAEKKQEEKTEEKGYYRIERSYGSFQRVLALPEDADKEAIKASYKDGVLNITMPRSGKLPEESKTISIESKSN